VTCAALAAMGTSPGKFFRQTFYIYGHRNVVRAVSAGLGTSGSVDGYVFEVLRETEPALIEHTRIIERSEWLGFPPIACAAAAANSRRNGLARAGLQSDSRDEHRWHQATDRRHQGMSSLRARRRRQQAIEHPCQRFHTTKTQGGPDETAQPVGRVGVVQQELTLT
jgi:ABC transporter, phosphonate, periplasmic substrate-binding protein